MYVFVSERGKEASMYIPPFRAITKSKKLSSFFIIDQNGERKVPKLFLWCLRERRDETQPILLYVLKFWSEMREMIVAQNTDMM